MNNDWNEEEDNFNLALSQRTEELYRVPNFEPDANGLIEALVLPLRDLVVFPRMVSPLFVGREASLLALQEAQHRNQTVIGLTQSDPEIEEPSAKDFLPIGVEMAVGRLLHMPDGSSSALERALELAGERALVLSAGSVAFAGEIRAAWKKRNSG